MKLKLALATVAVTLLGMGSANAQLSIHSFAPGFPLLTNITLTLDLNTAVAITANNAAMVYELSGPDICLQNDNATANLLMSSESFSTPAAVGSWLPGTATYTTPYDPGSFGIPAAFDLNVGGAYDIPPGVCNGLQPAFFLYVPVGAYSNGQSFSGTYFAEGEQGVDAAGNPLLTGSSFDYTVNVIGGGVVVPEPGTVALLIGSIIGGTTLVRRRRK